MSRELVRFKTFCSWTVCKRQTQWWMKHAHFCRHFRNLHEITQGWQLTPEGTFLTGSSNKGDRNRIDLLTKFGWMFPVYLPVLKLLKLSFKQPENLKCREMFYSENEFRKCSWSSFQYIEKGLSSYYVPAASII